MLGTLSCSDEDEPDTAKDAAPDRPADTRSDTSVGMDVSSDRGADASPDASLDTGAPDRGTSDGGTSDGGPADGGPPDTGPEAGNCVGGGDAARDGALGMLAVQALRCANCHQEEPVDAGLILSGRTMTTVPDAAVFPKNLTPDLVTGLGCWTDQQIINAVMNGLDQQGMMMCTRMPRFGTRIDGGTAQEIVDFLRTLPAINKAIPQTTVCPPQPPPPEGGTDADGGSTGDGGADADGGAPDGAAPDTGDGGSPPDAGPDAAPDAGTDGSTLDSGVDTGTNDVATDIDIDAGG